MEYGCKRTLKFFFYYTKIKYIMKKKIFTYTILLSFIGLIMIYSSSSIISLSKYNNPYRYVILQSSFFIIGFILMIIFSKIDYKIYKKYSNQLLFFSMILLILVLIPGIGKVRNGSRSWFGLFGLGFQPSEVSKLSLIIFVSKYLSNNDNYKRQKYKFILPIFLVIVFFFLLILLEPDFGTGMVIVMSLIGIIYASGVDVSIFYKIGFVILILVAPYRLARILSFLNPWSDPLGSGFQMIQSLYAIGPGGLLGFGFLNSRQKHFYLPEPQTDFIFSVICEEFGFIGAFTLVLLFVLLYSNMIKSAINQTDLFGKYLIFGLSFLLIFQTLLNLSVVVGLVPITGVTLPFISYGGSSLVVSMISIGIIMNISTNDK